MNEETINWKDIYFKKVKPEGDEIVRYEREMFQPAPGCTIGAFFAQLPSKQWKAVFKVGNVGYGWTHEQALTAAARQARAAHQDAADYFDSLVSLW